MADRYDYDVAVSFADEDRSYVQEVVQALNARALRVFYDADHEAHLWGRDLIADLADVYSKRSRFVIIFISQFYARRNWHRHELRSSLTRAIRDRRGTILPARLDDSEVPGLPLTMGVVDCRRMLPAQLADLIAARIRRADREQLEPRESQGQDVSHPSPVFVSHAPESSRRQVDVLRGQLEAIGVRVFSHPITLGVGDSIPHDVFDALIAAKVMVLFCGPAYFTRRYCVEEFAIALAAYRSIYMRGGRDDEIQEALLPIVIAIQRGGHWDPELELLPPGLRSMNWPLADDSRSLVAIVRDRLVRTDRTIGMRLRGLGELDGITDRVNETMPIPSPRGVGDLLLYCESGLPSSIGEAFVGRSRELWSLHTALASRESGGVVLEGGGGFGKTRLALEYLHRYAADTHRGGLFWIGADVPADRLEAQLHGVLRVLRPATPPLGDFPALGLDVRQELGAALREQSASGRILYVVDNVPQPEGMRPPDPLTRYCPAAAHVSLLVTSRARLSPVPGVRRLQIHELSPESARRLLTRDVEARHVISSGSWLQIAAWAGRLPLVLELLNAMLRTGTITAGELLAAVRQGDGPARLADRGLDALRPMVPPGSLRGVTEALDASYSRLPQDARVAAYVLAWLSPDAIPARVVADVELFSPQVRGHLRVHSFVTEVSTGPVEMFGRMHRVMADYLRGRASGAEAELSLNRACATLLGILRPEAVQDTANWPLLDACRPHAEAVLERCLPPGGRADVLAIGLGFGLTEFLRTSGRFDAALHWAERCLDVATSGLGADHAITMGAKLHVAEALRVGGQLARARELLEELRAPLAAEHGGEAPTTLAAQLSLAATLHGQGELEPARLLLEDLLAVQERLRGAGHRDTVVVATQLGLTLYEQGEVARARALLERALESGRQSLAETTPQLLSLTSSLAVTLADQGDRRRSTALLELVLELSRSALGEAHPISIVAATNLAVNMKDAGDVDRAVELLRQVTEASERTLSERHPDALVLMNNLATAVAAQSDGRDLIADPASVAQAAELRHRVRDTSLRIMGDRHPVTLLATINLADSLRTQGDLAGARRLAVQAERDCRKVLGPAHSHTLHAMGALATVLEAQAVWGQAIEMRERVLEARRSAFGAEHPDTLRAKVALAGALEGGGQRRRAREILEEIHEAAERVLGEEHPDALMAALALASMVLEDGDFPRGRVLGEHILSISERTLGPDHPQTLIAKAYLGPILRMQKDTARAEELRASIPEPADRAPIELVLARSLAGGPGEASLADLRAALDLTRSQMGEEAPTTLAVVAGVGMLLVNGGDMTAAIELLDPALPAMRRVLGPGHQLTAGALLALGGAYQLQGDGARAETLFDEALANSRAALGEEHPTTLMAMAAVGARLGSQGRTAEAADLLERAARISQNVHGADSQVTRSLTAALATLRGLR